MVDLGIQMVGASRQHDAAALVFLHPAQHFLAFFLHILMKLLHFCPGSAYRLRDFIPGNVEIIAQLLIQPGNEHLFALEGEEGVAEINVRIAQLFNIIFDVLRVGGDNGAVVVVVGIRILDALVGDARVEDELQSLSQQPFHMAVGQLGRITFGFAGNRLDSHLVNFSVGFRGKDHAEAKLCKKCIPEGIVFVHVQYPGDTNRAPGRFLLRKRIIGKQPLVLVCKQVRYILAGLFLTHTFFTAVAGDEPPAVAEFVDGHETVVRTAVAAGHGGGECQILDLLNGKHGADRALLVALPGDEGSAEGAHDTGDIRADGLAVGDLLKAAENGIIIEGTALDDNIFAQLCGGRHLDDLEQGVFDDGVSQPCGDVRHRGTLFLRLFYLGVHENGAAGTQVDGMFGKQRFLGEILYRVI